NDPCHCRLSTSLCASLSSRFFFFFSSRRRHTRWPRDWSSDVCSSDLGICRYLRFPVCNRLLPYHWIDRNLFEPHLRDGHCHHDRSEERRVGKECRSRGLAEH